MAMSIVSLQGLSSIAIHWYQQAKESEKKGIKALASIWKYKGKKRFKQRRNHSTLNGTIDNDTSNGFHNISMNEYQERRKQNVYRSWYGDFFNSNQSLSFEVGKKNQLSILSYHKFSDLPCTDYLKSEIKTFLDKYQELKDDEYYPKLIMDALKSLQSFLSSSSNFETVHRKSFQTFYGGKMIKNDRVDKLIESVRMSVKTKFAAPFDGNSKRVKSSRMMFRMGSAASKRISTKVDPHKLKISFFKGKDNLLSLFQRNDNNKPTTYQNSFTGIELKDIPKNTKHLFMNSQGAGTIIPDKNEMRKSNARLDQFKAQLMTFDHDKENKRRLTNLRHSRASTTKGDHHVDFKNSKYAY